MEGGKVDLINWDTKKIVRFFQSTYNWDLLSSRSVGGVNLSQNAVPKKILKILRAGKNFRIDQSAHSIFDYPKMPRFSKKASLVNSNLSYKFVR